MKPEISHPDSVRVRITKRDPQARRARNDITFLGGKFALIAFDDAFAHEFDKLSI